MSKANILFDDGTIYEAEANLSGKTVIGEIVFNTSMTGYQEILTDPSYTESNKIQASAFIIRENAETHIEGIKSLSDYLAENEILCINNIDTRKLTKIIRSSGSRNCLITTEGIKENHKKMLKEYEFPKDIVAQVSEKKTETIKTTKKRNTDFAIIDYGVKKGIVNQLLNAGADVTIYPYNIDAETILKKGHKAVMLSNGPGDPKDVNIETVKKLLGKIPIYGICLGHQISALALGGDTYKLKFGHRGANHPVIDTRSGKVIITSQNHGYAVDEGTLPKECKITYKNINDGTVEGFSHREIPLECVQFHPEGGPGPEDAGEIFAKWVKSVSKETEDA